jgi:hypothetical protein
VEIISFDVSGDHIVTLNMKDLPLTGARTTNTTIYIGGSSVGAPDEISGRNQRIVFFAGSASQSGRITVSIQMPEGDLSATSEDEYTVEEPDTTHQPVITNVQPDNANRGDRVTLRGRTLQFIDKLRVGQTQVTTMTASSDTSVQFTVPMNTPDGDHQISVWSKNDFGWKMTPRRLTVPKRQGD